MKYYLSPDITTIAISILGLIAIGSMISYVIYADKWYSTIPTLLVTGLLIYFFLKTPYYVYIGKDFIEVKQIIGKKRINNIKKIEKVSKTDMANSIRKLGNGGFFGYTGRFYSPKLGNYNMIALNMKELVKVYTESGSIYVINYPHSLLKNPKGQGCKSKGTGL